MFHILCIFRIIITFGIVSTIRIISRASTISVIPISRIMKHNIAIGEPWAKQAIHKHQEDPVLEIKIRVPGGVRGVLGDFPHRVQQGLHH